MMVMFQELRAKQIRAEAEGRDGLSPEMRAFIEDAKLRDHALSHSDMKRRW